MISHEILKRAAAAGAVGAAVFGGAVWMTSETATSDGPCDRTESNKSAEISQVPAEEFSHPEVRKAPAPEETRPAEVEPQPADVDGAEYRARRDAMRRAVEQLAHIKRMNRRGGEVSDATVRRLESTIDRAIRVAADRTSPTRSD